MRIWAPCVIIAAFMAFGLGSADGQTGDPQAGVPQILGTPGGGTVIILNQAPPVPERDKCSPLHSRLDNERCDSAYGPARTIRMSPGSQRVLRLDRDFTSIEIDSHPPGAVNARVGPDNVTAVIEAHEVGTAEIYIFGSGKVGRANQQVRDVLFAGAITVSEEPSYNVRIHNRPNLHEATEYACTGNGCAPPGYVIRTRPR